MIFSLALLAPSGLVGADQSPDYPGLSDFAAPGFEEPETDPVEEDPVDPGAEDPEEGSEDPEDGAFDPFETRSAYDGRIRLEAVVDLSHIDGDTRAALELPSTGVVYLYTPWDSTIDNTFVRLDGHPPMTWEALDQDGDSAQPPHAILTSEYWSREVLSTLSVVRDGTPMPEFSVLVDGAYASEDMRHASGYPEAPFYVVTLAEQGLQGPYDASPYGDMAVSVPGSGDPWADFGEYAQAPADYGSSVGFSWYLDTDASQAWRVGSDIGEGWEYEAVWFSNSPIDE